MTSRLSAYPSLRAGEREALMATFITRAGWGSRYGTGGHSIGQVGDVVLHHTPGQDGQGEWNEAVAQVQAIEYGHVVKNGWSAIGYTWLVSGDYAFEGRGFGRSGAHAPGANSSSIGIAFILDGRYRAPTNVEWATAAAVVRRAVLEGHLSRSWQVQGHRDWVATECPARLIYDSLGSLRAAVDGSLPDEGELTVAQIDELRAAIGTLTGKVDRLSDAVWAYEQWARARFEAGEAQDVAAEAAADRRHAERRP